MIFFKSCPQDKLEKISFCFGLLVILTFFLFLSLIVKNNNVYNLPGFKKIFGFRDLLPTPAPYPVNQGVSALPDLSVQSAIALDVLSMVPLYEKDAGLLLSPASTTKIMTALVALDYYPLEKVLTVGEMAVEGQKIGLGPGEQITVRALLYGLLIGSGNDAAAVLADNFPEREAGFVWAMNRKAEELKLEGTHFSNYSGLDSPDHYSTARDMARMTVTALKNPLFAEIVAIKAETITDVTGEVKHVLKNTNELVGEMEGVKGVKTGWTQNAGECLVTLVSRDGREVLTVLLGSQNRFAETRILIDWLFENFSWQAVAPSSYR